MRVHSLHISAASIQRRLVSRLRGQLNGFDQRLVVIGMAAGTVRP